MQKSSSISNVNSQSFFWAENVNHFATNSDTASSYALHTDFTGHRIKITSVTKQFFENNDLKRKDTEIYEAFILMTRRVNGETRLYAYTKAHCLLVPDVD